MAVKVSSADGPPGPRWTEFQSSDGFTFRVPSNGAGKVIIIPPEPEEDFRISYLALMAFARNQWTELGKLHTAADFREAAERLDKRMVDEFFDAPSQAQPQPALQAQLLDVIERAEHYVQTARRSKGAVEPWQIDATACAFAVVLVDELISEAGLDEELAAWRARRGAERNKARRIGR